MKGSAVLVAAGLSAILAGCATSPLPVQEDYTFVQQANAYDAKIREIRPPRNRDEQAEVCQYLRVERAHKQDGVRRMERLGPDGDASITRLARSIAIIESRMSEFGC